MNCIEMLYDCFVPSFASQGIYICINVILKKVANKYLQTMGNQKLNCNINTDWQDIANTRPPSMTMLRFLIKKSMLAAQYSTEADL